MKTAMTIDITPTWKAAMQIYLAVLDKGTPDGKQIAREELMKLAGEVDKINAESEAEGPAEDTEDTLIRSNAKLNKANEILIDGLRLVRDYARKATGKKYVHISEEANKAILNASQITQ